MEVALRRPLLAAALAGLALAGCGDDEGAESSGPASLAPAESVVYAEGVLRPEGELRTALDTSLSALLDSEDPGALIVAELNQQLAEDDSEITYEIDIEPWLGERGAVFFTSLYGSGEASGDETAGAADEDDSFAGEGVEGAFVIEATDTEAAQAFTDTAGAEEGSVEESSYEGVDYKVGGGGDAFGIVGDALVFGSEQGLRAAVDTEAGDESLAGDADFSSLLGSEADAAGTLFVDVPEIVTEAEAAGELTGSELETIDSLFAGIADEPLTAVLDAEPDGFGLELSYGATDLPFLAAAEESALLRELPGDSWLAAGFTDVGDAIASFLDGAGDLGVAADELDAIRDQFRREYGLELEEFYEPLGDGAFFANGEGIFGTGGGVVLETDDPEAAGRLIAGLERAAKRGGEQVRSLSGGNSGAEGFSITIDEAPGAINFVAGGDRIVIAYGDAATGAAFEPGEAGGTLGESEGFSAAEDALGEDFDVTGYLDFAPLVELLGFASATDPSLQQALPYLESLDFVITGAGSDGEHERMRLFLGVADVVAEPSA